MGTRHIVEIIKDNKTAIRQYGQWDGYAETAAYQLRNFIKEYGAERVRKLIDMTEIQNNTQNHNNEPDMLINPSGFHMAESMIGYNTSEVDAYIDKIKMLGNFWMYGIEDTALAIIPAVVEKFGLEKTMKHYLLTRDTGYKILDVLGIFSCFNEIQCGKLKIPVFLEEDYVDTSRKIIINLDNETFTCKYFEGKQTWNFNKLPTLAELRKVDKW